MRNTLRHYAPLAMLSVPQAFGVCSAPLPVYPDEKTHWRQPDLIGTKPISNSKELENFRPAALDRYFLSNADQLYLRHQGVMSAR